MRGYQEALRALQRGVVTKEVTDEDVVPAMQKFTVHEWRSGTGHGKGRQLVTPALPWEGNLEPVDDVLIINFCSSVNDGPSESAPHLGGSEITLKEHAHVGGREVDRLVDTHESNAVVFSSERPNNIQIWVRRQGSVNRLWCQYVEGGINMMQADSETVCTSDGATGHISVESEGEVTPCRQGHPHLGDVTRHGAK